MTDTTTLEEELLNIASNEEQQPNGVSDKQGEKALDLISPSTQNVKPPVETTTSQTFKFAGILSDESLMDIPMKELLSQVKQLEKRLNIKTKGLSTKNKQQLCIILEQRQKQLSGDKEQNINFQDNIRIPDPIEQVTESSKEYIPETTSNCKDSVDMNKEKSDDSIPEISARGKPPVVHKSKKTKVPQVDPLEKANADMLFRMNLLFLFSVETISEKYQDNLNTSFTGVTKKMASDYDRDEYLRGIYARIYRENKETIQQYASPLSELALYNASVLGTFAATNLDKSIKKNETKPLD